MTFRHFLSMKICLDLKSQLKGSVGPQPLGEKHQMRSTGDCDQLRAFEVRINHGKMVINKTMIML